MTWFRNKVSELTWEVIDQEVIKRLKNDSNFEEVVEDGTIQNTNVSDNTEAENTTSNRKRGK